MTSESGATIPRSVIWGFQPVYFEPVQVKAAIEIILFDEWGLPRRGIAAGEP